MEEMEDNMSADDINEMDNYFYKIKPKKRSLVERELETNLTERITSPIIISDSTNTSRYGRARRLKTDSENNDIEKVNSFKSSERDKSPIKSPVYKMHASNSPIRIESQNKSENNLDHQIENIYNENISLSRFGDDKSLLSGTKQSPKVYIRRDLLQTKEKEVTVTLIKNYSPKGNKNSGMQASKKSCKKYSTINNKQIGYLDNSSVVKTLDFDGNKKKNKGAISKSDLFELEAKCEYQVGDLAWAKMGTYPYWPCIVTRDPVSGMFVKKKLFGRIDRDMIHVTFFGDNGRRSWILENMLRNFLGQLEFEAARDQFTSEAKRKDPRCAAFFVSERKLPQWRISVDEAETLLREPKRLRIDLLNDMLNKTATVKTTPKGSKKVTRTDSDVSLSESLYDTLFSEEDTKTHDIERAKRPRNKSLDVSEVVTACLDNMAAKTGITKIQKQSHMDRWLQKAKSKTPEKSQLKSQSNSHNPRQDRRSKVKSIKKEPDLTKSFPFTMSDNESLNEADNKLHAHQNEHDYSEHCSNEFISQPENGLFINLKTPDNGFGIISKVKSLRNKSVTNISKDAQDVEVVVADDCMDSLDVNESNSVCDIIIEDVKVFNDTIEDDDVYNDVKANNHSTINKALIEKIEPFVDLSGSKSTTCGLNDVRVNGDEPSSLISTCNLNNTDLETFANEEVYKSSKSDTEKKETYFLKENQNNPLTPLKTHLTNRHDSVNYELYIEPQRKEDSIAVTTCNKNEDLDEKSLRQTLGICDDDVTFKEDQEKEYVIIAKTIISDKLVGNIVDSNKIEFNNDINEISTFENFTVNVDCDLTIPETDGHSNKPNIIDDYIKVNNHDDTEISIYTNTFCEASDILGNKSEKVVHNSDFALSLSNSGDGSVNNIGSEALYSHRNKKVEHFKPNYLEDEYILSNSHKDNVGDVVTNGFVNDKDDSLGTDSSSNCNLYLSSEDEDRSVSSILTDLNKYKTKFVKKNHKHITLQDALVRQDLDNGSDIIVIDGIEKSSIKNNNHEEMYVTDERSQNTSADSERSLTDSNLTCYSDSKSLYSEAQTETTVATETTATMDIDESTYESLSKNGSKTVTNETEIDFAGEVKTSPRVNLCEEKAILVGDELRLTPHGLQVINENCIQNDLDVNKNVEDKVKSEIDADTESVISTDSEVSCSKRKMRWKTEKPNLAEKKINLPNLENPDFLKYLELKQDAIYDEHPELSQEEITTYLYNTWLYEENLKTDTKKTDDMESASMVKGLETDPGRHQKKVRKRIKVEKDKGFERVKGEQIVPKQKPKRRTMRPSYNEEYSDIEEDLEVFSIPKPKDIDTDGVEAKETEEAMKLEVEDEIDEVEEYFARLTEPKPNVFKGLLREKVCDICEKPGNMVKCKGCSSMFHLDCVSKQTQVVEVQVPMKGRKKKKKFRGRKSRSDENGLDESQSDEKDANVPEDLASVSTDNNDPEPFIVANADDFETQLAVKMKEMLGEQENAYTDTFSSDEELDWSDTEVGRCEVVDIKLRKKKDDLAEYSEFKCNNCQKYDVPVCCVCRRAESPKTNALHRQRCQVAQCNKYYHLECLEHWPQTQFNSGDSARYNKKVNEYFEALTCPRHVCHTCVSDDPRGCKTRFCADKLARCVRCPATYHTFTKCLPAGTQILTGSHIVCPRHHEHRPGKNPCHVNTGWCFICALGGTLICCEYCPTSFHAECLNIKPPEGGYMCEDCETGRLPLYGEMVWVKLGHYRWWPGIILHPCEIPENILAVKHSPGEFVVRFFGQYDHYWVNRGRVFPFQEGDSGKISSQKSKIDAAFTMAMEHAQRACEILKTAPPNTEESDDIASSLLPPRYVRLRANRPCGALCSRVRADAEGSLTQCECSPGDAQPCGPYTHCLNRMLLTECGPTCRAGERCHNRAFEKRLYPKLVPYRTPYRGWGLKTLEDIKAGQFVIEYVGELIDEEEFQRRMRRKQEIRDENFYFLTLDKERMIDAGPKGNLARFMNHCCEPNCETQKWTVLGDVRVGLFALTDIPANSEVTFNYNLESAGIEKKRCLCGAKRCSGYIGAKLKQAEPPKKPKRPYNKKRKVEDSPTTSKVKPKAKLGRPPKPKELTDIEKDLLIIKNATNGISSDSDCSGRLSSIESIKDLKASKRKRVGQSTEDSSSNNTSQSTKKIKLTEEKSSEVCD